jgi:hypothetical protein
MAKLLRKDVLKLIRNLKDGSYKKNQKSLVSKDGKRFCCLGVWADQHGCLWDTNNVGDLIPIARNRKTASPDQGAGTLKPNVSFGLGYWEQVKLADLNDSYKSWKRVIAYLKEDILPKAK